jgi:hypothetical protein
MMVSLNKMGGVGREMTKNSFLAWILPRFTNQDLEGIVRAHDNTDKQLDILDRAFERADLPDSFMSDTYNAERKELVKKIEFMFQGQFKDTTEGVMKHKMGIGEVREDLQPQTKEKGSSQFKQHSKKGKVYIRSRRNWSDIETETLKSRLKDYDEGRLTGKDMKRVLTQTTGLSRSQSSVSSKIYHLRKVKETDDANRLRGGR